MLDLALSGYCQVPVDPVNITTPLGTGKANHIKMLMLCHGDLVVNLLSVEFILTEVFFRIFNPSNPRINYEDVYV